MTTLAVRDQQAPPPPRWLVQHGAPSPPEPPDARPGTQHGFAPDLWPEQRGFPDAWPRQDAGFWRRQQAARNEAERQRAELAD